jgi:large subunit ribosomal protein L4
MAKIDVLNLEGKKVGTLELADEVFGGINEDLLWEAVKHYRAAQRAGTHATKNKKLVSGAGKKLWKQKGTGRARVGSIRSPLWRHGGTVHGPQPRSYDYQFPKKKLLGALRSALASKLSDGKLMVVDGFELEAAKTGAFRKTLGKLGIEKTALLVDGEKENRNLELSSRNIPGVKLVAGHQVHPYHLLRYKTAIFARPALEKLQESLKASAPKRKAEVA